MGVNLLPVFLALLAFSTTAQQNFDVCQSTTPGAAKPPSLCGTPYCTCNNPYGRVQCSCAPQNDTIPRVSAHLYCSSSAGLASRHLYAAPPIARATNTMKGCNVPVHHNKTVFNYLINSYHRNGALHD